MTTPIVNPLYPRRGRAEDPCRELPRLRSWIALLTLVLIGFGALAGCASRATRPSSPALSRALELYQTNALEAALPHFQAAVAENTQDARAHAWLAEVYRRLGNSEAAHEEAQQALFLDPEDGLAYTVLGDLFNPQYAGWKGHQDEDQAYAHYRSAIEAEPRDASPWLGLLPIAMRRGDDETEVEALQRMYDTNFFTPAILALSRWLLDHLPPDAVVLVNGDMDFYPVVMLQHVEKRRPDVAVVQGSLLNLAWYRDAVTHRYGLPEFPASLAPRVDASGQIMVASTQAIEILMRAYDQHRLDRPVAVALTMPWTNLPEHSRGRLRLMGAHYELTRGEVEDANRVAFAAVEESLASLKPRRLAGPAVSDYDHSPVRRSTAPGLLGNPVQVALHYVYASFDDGRAQQACSMLSWVDSYQRTVEVRPDLRDRVEEALGYCEETRSP